MSDDLHLANELIEELEKLSIRTSAGSYVKMEDVRRLIEKKKEADTVQEAQPKPKTLIEARALAKEHLAKAGIGQKGPQEPGKAIPATEPRPSSRT